jgi:hypothetical protein
MMRALKENSVTLAAAEKLPPDEREGKILRGVLCNIDRPGYVERYNQIIAAAQGKPLGSEKRGGDEPKDIQ